MGRQVFYFPGFSVEDRDKGKAGGDVCGFSCHSICPVSSPRTFSTRRRVSPAEHCFVSRREAWGGRVGLVWEAHQPGRQTAGALAAQSEESDDHGPVTLFCRVTSGAAVTRPRFARWRTRVSQGRDAGLSLETRAWRGHFFVTPVAPATSTAAISDGARGDVFCPRGSLGPSLWS